MSNTAKGVNLIGKTVEVTLLDGETKGEKGIVFGMGLNSKEQPVFLVEMQNTNPAQSGHQIGAAQVASGKPWTLSAFSEEIRPLA